MQTLTLQPIGFVRNAVTGAVDEDWGKVISTIELDESLKAGLQGIEDWSHVVVIFYMHETAFDPERHLLRRPRGRDDMPEVGIFAQRARYHPNNIGISAVRIVDHGEGFIRVKGLDAINNTPVLDIKPYAPVYDGVQEPLVPGWFIRLMQGYF